jgi:hypothetical protein
MNTYVTLLTGGGLIAAGAVVSGLLTNWLGSRRDKRGYEHEQKMAREARTQERLDQAYIALGGVPVALRGLGEVGASVPRPGSRAGSAATG